MVTPAAITIVGGGDDAGSEDLQEAEA